MAADPFLTPHQPAAPPPTRRRQQLVRRTDRDESQQLRRGFQYAFLALNVWIGVEFILWVRHLEGSAAGASISRPPGIEGWLPIAALMNLKAWIVTGKIPWIHPAAMFLLVAFLAISLVLKKAFCSWLCPVGTISELLWRLGARMFGRNFSPPRWVDIPLRSLKYLLFAFFAWAVLRMSADDIASFMQTPYGIVADVKLLNFFRFIGTTGLIVVGLLVVLSLFIQNFWCRYLCPYGALLGIVALASPARIRRDADACIDCAKCTRACPSRLPVDVKPQIRSAECTMCMACVAVCPARGALDVKVTKRRKVSARAVAAIIAVIFLAIVGAARLTGHWKTDLSEDIYRSLVIRASDLGHPAGE